MINISVTHRPVPGTHGTLHQWYGAVKSNGTTTTDQMADRVTAMCTVTRHDVVAVLAALQEQIIEVLKSGCGVSLGELGTIYVHCKSVLADSPAECSTDMVESLYPIFLGSKKLRRSVAKGGLKFNIASYGQPYVAPVAPAA